jgi:hypothetical protein
VLFVAKINRRHGLAAAAAPGVVLWRDGYLNWAYSHLMDGKEVFRDVTVFLPHNWDIIKETSAVGLPDRKAPEVIESLVQGNVSEADLTEFLKTLPPKSIQIKMLSAARTRFAPRIIPVRLFTAAYKKLPGECKRRPGEHNRTIARG